MLSVRSLLSSFMFASVLSLSSSVYAETAQDKPVKNDYPPEVMKTFMKGCEYTNNKTYCACILDKLQYKYSFAEFTQIDNAARETRKIPIEVQAIVTSCGQLKNNK